MQAEIQILVLLSIFSDEDTKTLNTLVEIILLPPILAYFEKQSQDRCTDLIRQMFYALRKQQRLSA